jgi:predicted secreted protein
LDATDAEVNIKSGVAGTSGAVNWTFNTDSTNYASLKLPYDTRATTGFHIDVGYPITIDATTRINFNISGTNYATFDTNGYNGQLNSYTEKARSDSIGTATYTVNCNNENIITLTMTGNPTIAFSNVPASGTAWSCTLLLKHSGGARTVTWPASVKWQGGSAPTLSGSGDTDIITLFTVDGGTNWYGSTAGLDFS